MNSAQGGMNCPGIFPWCATFFASVICLLSGCSASGSPLSITLFNPKTGIQRTCSARESSSKEADALSRAVEACAKQLEAHGFIRAN
jgi:hypothetical protein